MMDQTDWKSRALVAEKTVFEFCQAAKEAPNILNHMIETSRISCPPMHYLLTHDGMYGFHMANLWVRNDGIEYTMEADWADNCGKLVKRLTEVMGANADVSGAPSSAGQSGCASNGATE